jgi:hypothetical protein
MPDQKSEDYESKRIGATPTPNSGRGRAKKGDSIIYMNGEALLTVDVKEYSESFGLSRNAWNKIRQDAKTNNSKPCLKVVLGTDEPRIRTVVISEEMFNELMETYRERWENE